MIGCPLVLKGPGVYIPTADGSEIRCSPVEVGSLSVYPITYTVLYMPGGAGVLPSTVDWMNG